MEKSEIIKDLNALFKKRSEFYSFFDENIEKLKNTEVFDFKNAKDLNAQEMYKRFYHYDYAIRKILPAIYKAYKITSADLEKDF